MQIKDGGCSNCSSSCSGGCSSSCSGGCKNGCKGTCGHACSTECTLGCGSLCTHGCGGNCENSCKDGCENSCKDGCERGCKGKCGGTCTTGCTSCTGNCTSCDSSCSGGCKETCENGCKKTCKTGCGNQCTGKDMASISNLSLDKHMNATNISEISAAISYEATRRAAKDSLKEISFTFGEHIDDEKINILISNFNLLGHKLSKQPEGKRSLESIGQEIVDKIKIAWKENYNNDNL